jgi:hypothetical protein
MNSFKFSTGERKGCNPRARCPSCEQQTCALACAPASVDRQGVSFAPAHSDEIPMCAGSSIANRYTYVPRRKPSRRWCPPAVAQASEDPTSTRGQASPHTQGACERGRGQVCAVRPWHGTTSPFPYPHSSHVSVTTADATSHAGSGP